MRSRVRFSFLALLVGVIVAVAIPAAANAAVEIEKFVGVNCKTTAETCGEKVVGADIFGEPIAETVEPTLTESEAQGYRQAGGHVPFGVTDFTLKHTGSLASASAVPTGVATHVRVDVATGLAMFFARYWIAIPVLALAGSLAKKKCVPVSSGTLPTHTPLFVFFLISVVVIVGALTFFPALALGPIVEHLMTGGLS